MGRLYIVGFRVKRADAAEGGFFPPFLPPLQVQIVTGPLNGTRNLSKPPGDPKKGLVEGIAKLAQRPVGTIMGYRDYEVYIGGI